MTGRKPKPVTLDRVPNEDPGHFRYGIPGQTRFTVRRDYKPDPKRPGWAFRTPVFAVYDKQRDDWLYPNPKHPAFSRKQYRTRAEAWDYLQRTTIEDREYRLEMLNRALDRPA